MIEIIPEKLKLLAGELKSPLYAVGGVCRDYLADLSCGEKDWDICAPVGAEEVKSCAERVGFAVSAVYKNTGTVKLKADGAEYEYACFRSDKYVRGVHSPAEVFFTDDIALDARRRDFKCNAVYYDIKAEKFVDPLGGIDEIRERKISAVVSPVKVFGEDGLRLLRLCRIAAQTGFTPTAECLEGARRNANLIADIASERIYAELNAILHADLRYGVKGAQARGLELLAATGVLKIILPELAAGQGMEQRSDYHDYDVWTHTVKCVEYADPEVRLAALFHDVGKPYCKITTGKFAAHETEGERIARQIFKRLRVPSKLAEFSCALIRWHMYDLSLAASVNKVKKFIVAHHDIYAPLLKLKQADYSACKNDLSVAPCVKKWEGIYSEMQKDGVPFTLKQLNVKGDKLIAAGICPEQVGKTLSFLLGECAIGNVRNEESMLTKYALARLNS